MKDSVTLIAIRDVEPGEEITFDYAMVSNITQFFGCTLNNFWFWSYNGTTTAPNDNFKCKCKAKACRGFISSNDWEIPELQERYRDYFFTVCEGIDSKTH